MHPIKGGKEELTDKGGAVTVPAYVDVRSETETVLRKKGYLTSLSTGTEATYAWRFGNGIELDD